MIVMLWPLIACLLLPGILAYYGLHIVRRGIIFVDLALAQVAALGTCFAVLFHYTVHDWQTYALGASFTFVGAAIFTFTRNQKREVPQEALIGIVYVVTAAASILLLSRSPEGNEEWRRTLVGDILVVQWQNVLKTFVLYLLIGGIHVVFRRHFLALTFTPEKIPPSRMSPLWWDFLFYVLFGFIVTSFVQIGGILLVFSYLIIPAVCASYLASSLGKKMCIAWSIATAGGILGLTASYKLELPAGAAIVCALGALLLLAANVAKFVKKPASANLDPK